MPVKQEKTKKKLYSHAASETAQREIAIDKYIFFKKYSI